MVSARVDDRAYTPMKLLLSREGYIKAIAISLEVSNAILPSLLCTDPIPPLASTLTIFKATLDSNSVVLKDKEQFSKVGNHFAE